MLDVLTHTSGLTNELQDTPVAALYQEAGIHADATRSLAEFVDALTELPLAFQPGERWHYSASLDVAARLIEIIADQPLGEVLDERLFQPLGMTDTGFAVPERRERLAAMYGRPDVLGRGQTAMGIYEAWARGENERRDVSNTHPADASGVFARGGFGLFSTRRPPRVRPDAARWRRGGRDSGARAGDRPADVPQPPRRRAAAVGERRPTRRRLRLRPRFERADGPGSGRPSGLGGHPRLVRRRMHPLLGRSPPGPHRHPHGAVDDADGRADIALQALVYDAIVD